MFSQSPIEAAIWSSFVAVQEAIATTLLDTLAFKAAVFTWLGFLFIKAVYSMSSHESPGVAFSRFLVSLVICAFGFSFLTLSNSSFEPLDANSEPWPEASHGLAAPTRNKFNLSRSNGLNAYKTIHGASNEIATFLSDNIAKLFSDHLHSQSPYLFLNTMAQTAAATIDDPAALSDLDWLFQNCADNKTAPILEPTSSYSTLFSLAVPACKSRYNKLISSLKNWADLRWSTSVLDVGDVGAQYVASTLGFGDEETLKNKIIASAMVNVARSRMGKSKENPTHNKALLDDSSPDDFLGSSTTFFVGLSNVISPGGFLHRLLSPITGTDIYGADARNQSAYLYNRIIQFLPPVRGYAKGMIAVAFVFAAATMCFGSLKYMVAWFGMLFVFSVYEPASTLLYEITMQFTGSSQVLASMEALKSDPLILSGAAIIDDNVARIQAVYFVLQMGLTAVCAAGGISCFFLTRQIGGGLSETITQKISGMARMIPMFK